MKQLLGFFRQQHLIQRYHHSLAESLEWKLDRKGDKRTNKKNRRWCTPYSKFIKKLNIFRLIFENYIQNQCLFQFSSLPRKTKVQIFILEDTGCKNQPSLTLFHATNKHTGSKAKMKIKKQKHWRWLCNLVEAVQTKFINNLLQYCTIYGTYSICEILCMLIFFNNSLPVEWQL